MENRAFRKFEWSVWKLLDCRILHQIPKGFWEPWAAPKRRAGSNEAPSEKVCLRAWTAFRFSWNICEFTMQVKHVFHVVKTILQNYRYITNTCACVESPYYLTFSNCRESSSTRFRLTFDLRCKCARNHRNALMRRIEICLLQGQRGDIYECLWIFNLQLNCSMSNSIERTIMVCSCKWLNSLTSILTKTDAWN